MCWPSFRLQDRKGASKRSSDITSSLFLILMSILSCEVGERGPAIAQFSQWPASSGVQILESLEIPLKVASAESGCPAPANSSSVNDREHQDEMVSHMPSSRCVTLGKCLTSLGFSFFTYKIWKFTFSSLEGYPPVLSFPGAIQSSLVQGEDFGSALVTGKVTSAIWRLKHIAGQSKPTSIYWKLQFARHYGIIKRLYIHWHHGCLW